jgi:hypothetical protein
MPERLEQTTTFPGRRPMPPRHEFMNRLVIVFAAAMQGFQRQGAASPVTGTATS